MRFEKFHLRTKSGRPKVTLSKRGRLSFNESAVRLLDITRTPNLELSFANDERVIGMQFFENRTRHSIKLRLGKTGAIAFAKRFLDYYGIDHSKTRRIEIGYCDGYAIAEVGGRPTEQSNKANEREGGE